MSVPFDALSFHFSDVCLIEASAGTGKTYSLANLYLRLVLGHVNDPSDGTEQHINGFERALPVDQILVLTFTNAATFELKERIHQRIQECLAYFIDDNALSPDGFLVSLRASFEQHDQLENACNRLRFASVLIDQASIFTLHSFCNRLIKNNVFALEQNTALQFEIDNRHNIDSVLRDMWRQLHSNDNSELQTAVIHSHWSSFDTFSKSFKPVLDTHAFTSINQLMVDEDTDFESLFESPYYRDLLAFKTIWLEQENEISQFFSQPCINRANLYTKRIQTVSAFCNNRFSVIPPEDPLFKFFSSDGIHKQIAKKHKDNPPDNLPIIAQIDRLQERGSTESDIKLHQWITLQLRKRWREIKEQQQLMYSSDVLHKLENALKQNDDFLTTVRTQYPVALIDEFQDTDQSQYEIFSTLYHGQADLSLVLIGDPKQAIYKFRGADLYTYINAKQRIDEDRIFHMESNWRSSAAMVSACNAIFSHQDNPFLNPAIPFMPVDSQAHIKAGQPLHGVLAPHAEHETHFQFFLHHDRDVADDKKSQKGHATDALFAHCAQTIQDMLSDDQMTVNNHPINSRDICILARSRPQAREIQSALLKHRIASAFLENNSVYKTDCARELSYVLRAFLEPENVTYIKTALSSHFYQGTRDSLSETNFSANDVLATSHQFARYQTHWNRYGIASMIEHWCLTDAVYERLLTLQNGLRWIADITHLSELLQEQSTHLITPQQTHDALSNNIELALNDSLEQQSEHEVLRLDNDQSLVNIVTVHSSKGLEFPIVFYPYACDYKKADGIVVHSKNEHGEYTQEINFDTSSYTRKEQLDKESLAEDIRLLYVALTRAKYACYVGLANTSELSKSALASVLGIPNNGLHLFTDIEDTLSVLAQHKSIDYKLVGSDIHTDYESLDTSNEPSNKASSITNPSFENRSTSTTTSELISPPTAPTVRQTWNVLSYSKLASHSSTPKPRVNDEPSVNEYQGADEWSPYIDYQADRPDDTPVAYSRFNFPKGPLIGQWLHTLFEHIEFGALTPVDSTHDDVASDDAVDNNTTSSQIRHAIEAESAQSQLLNIQPPHLKLLEEWITDTLNTSLLPASDSTDSVSLSTIQAGCYQSEMQFYVSIKQPCAAHDVSRLLKQHGYLNTDSDLNATILSGLLTGYIDLLFEHNQRYYILDYKSNYLGPSQNDYDHANMQRAISEHKYDVQYILYTLAIHRLLRQRMGDVYDYEQHMGGSVYLFLRGVAESSLLESEHTGVFFDKPPVALITALDRLFEHGVLP
ncbi:MAG: exodeoxyribonuclease V subunit beta [Pseudomonadota bacterium]